MVSIAVSAYSGFPSKKHLKLSFKSVDSTINALNSEQRVWFLGGYKGLMEKIVDYLLSLGEKVVLILPLEYELEHLPSQTIRIKTGMTFPNRNVIMVRSGDFLLALGGGAGSLMEVIAGIEMGKKVFLMVDTGLPTDILANIVDSPIIDSRKRGELYFFDSPRDLYFLIKEHYLNITQNNDVSL